MISKLEITQCIERQILQYLWLWSNNGWYGWYVWLLKYSWCRRFSHYYQDFYCCNPLYLCHWKVMVISWCCHANATLSLAGVPSQSTVELATSVCVALITTANGSTTVWERGITGKSLALWQECNTASIMLPLLFPRFSCISAQSVLSHTEPLFFSDPGWISHEKTRWKMQAWLWDSNNQG